MKRKIAVLLCMTLIQAGMITGCGGNNNTAAPETTVQTEESETGVSEETESTRTEAAPTDSVISDTTAAGWHIVVENVQINKSLENVSVDLGYTGVETSDYVKEAGDGNVFCLVKMKIEKDGSKEVIDWPALKLTDSEGNEYTRIEDEFITDLGMMRMSGTSLNFGSNEGWIAFEIKEGAEGLQLSYPFESETFTCDLPSA